MADNLQLYQDRQNQVENDQLGQAMHAASWTGTFNQPNSTENLRAQRNVTDLVAQAMDRKQQLAMQTDANAARIYQINQASRIAADQAPLRDQLLRSQIAAQGATTAFHQQQDAESQSHVAGFADYMTRAPQIGSPEYGNYILQGMQKFPRVATTQWGAKTLTDLGKAHDTAAALQSAISDYTKITGFAPESIETTATGGINLRGKQGGQSNSVPDSAFIAHQKALTDIQLHQIASDKEAQVNMKANKPNEPYSKSREMSASQGLVDSLEQKFPQLKGKAAPKHLGTYNPATGAFE